MGIGDDQVHSRQTSGLQSDQELAPELEGLAVSDGDAEDLAGAVDRHPCRHDKGLGDHVRTHPHLAIRRVEEHVRERGVRESAVVESGDLGVEACADAGDLGLRHSRAHAQRGDEVVDTAGRDAVDVGLHDHRMQGLVDPSAAFEQRGEERAGPQFGDLDLDVAAGGRDRLAAVSVAVRGSGVGAFVAAGAESLGGLGFDQLLQAGADQFGEHGRHIGALERVQTTPRPGRQPRGPTPVPCPRTATGAAGARQ